MPTRLNATLQLPIIILLLCCTCVAAEAPADQHPGLFLRVRLQAPRQRAWRVNVIALSESGKSKEVFAGERFAAIAKDAGWAAAAQSTGWIDLTDLVANKAATIRCLFEADPPLEKAGVEARIDVATAGDEPAILRTITDSDPGNVVSIRIPADASAHKDRLLSIRQDTQRRLDEIKAMHLPDGPLPKKIWCMTGFRSNGQFYTDPAIATMDMDIIRLLGMNGYWEQNGGQPGDLRNIAAPRGLDRSTVYWRSVESLPTDKALGGASPLKWDVLDTYLDKAYHDSIASTRAHHPGGLPRVIADLMDEPAGQQFDGPDYQSHFREYLQQAGLNPLFFGKSNWEEITPIRLGWRNFFTQRAELGLKDESSRRLFYWSAKFWNHAVARVYAMATQNVERNAPGTPTRVNFGPPWWYDYGTLPRGIDAFEFGRLRSVTLGFNEDWVGKGSARVPLEINALLMDWSRAAARPATPLLGCYITRDADRASVKLRTFACLAREAKIFDFYYYGPAYTFFDHWSDNLSMVQGVGELTRDLGAADDVLWEGRATRARAALLYSQSWPVWKADDSEQCEQVMAYIALLHAGVPVDIVSDTEIADRRFAARNYKCLYVVNESIPSAAAMEIEHWVHNGGKLWASGWAGMKDQYNTPTDAWNAMLGVASRTWKPTGDLKRLGEPIRPDDWTRPIFDREMQLQFADEASLQFTDPSNKMRSPYRRPHGGGLVQVVPTSAGKEYMDGAREQSASLAKATIFPSDQRRQVFADFAKDAGIEPPATTSVSQILAWPLWAQHKGVILLANYTGEPTAQVKVNFSFSVPVTKARSLRHGDLPITRPDPGHGGVTLPMHDVTDIILLE